ncbi:hypothetical protein [Bradyrhizobium sp. CCGB01]|uniref:hypothetical protein n=1 Tax=Bradyrhizobium sp. CCGB01 TaxID=2949634 RepID=UPI0020B22174|nr:hypothetical protein [Bradyrhizobium sp. CCGB01]MCP3405563.1 hypothetical protein [Bradyrhizobium sp. CCGB01]
MNLGGSLVVLVASDAGLLCTVSLLDGNFVRGVNSRGLNADLVRASHSSMSCSGAFADGPF